jgi:hypothetical protein
MAKLETNLAESAPRFIFCANSRCGFDFHCLKANFVSSWDWHSGGLSRLMADFFPRPQPWLGTAIADDKKCFSHLNPN